MGWIWIIVLGFLIFVHELGHFLVAKYFRVGVLEFALGFGPKLWSYTWGETTYSLRIVPLGGFVRMVGDDPRGVAAADQGGTDLAADGTVGGASAIEGKQEKLNASQEALLKDESRWLLKQPYFPKLAIVLAGPLFNLLTAFVLATGYYFIQGVPVSVKQAYIGSVIPKMPAEKAGLKVGDKIVEVNGKVINTFEEFVQSVKDNGGNNLKLGILRAKGMPAVDANTGALVAPEAPTERVDIDVMPTSEESDVDIVVPPEQRMPFKIGVAVAARYVEVPFHHAAYIGGYEIYGQISKTLLVLKKLVTLAVNPTRVIGGPIAIVKQIETSAESGASSLIRLIIFLNVMLAVMNLLPIPVLDGGHVVMFTIEKLKGSPLTPGFMDVAGRVGVCLLLALMIFAVGNDIVKHFTS